MARPVSKAATTDFGREIDAICARRGWTLSDFARHAGIAEGGSQVSRYRGGKPKPTLERLAEWEARPEIAPEMARLRAALQRDIAKSAQVRTEKARAKIVPASDRPAHVTEALAAVEAILLRSAPGPWIAKWIRHLELEASDNPLPNHKTG